MKICPNCKSQIDDNVMFCNVCGARQDAQAGGAGAGNYTGSGAPGNMGVPPQQYTMAYDKFDHTAEFDKKDISDNKVIAMLVYLLGTVGVIIALLASSKSAYAAFHVRQALKFTVVSILLGIITLVLCWTIIVPVLYAICLAVLFVLKIICFFQICSGKAVEPYIIRNLGFLV